MSRAIHYRATINRLFLFITALVTSAILRDSYAQDGAKPYQETAARINDLVHTKLAVKFDYAKKYLYGREWVTLRPHCYPTDSLRLDAKGMDIKNISLFQKAKLVPLRYQYDSLSLQIQLDRIYKSNERYTIYIEYVAKPSELKNRRKNEKGLYFINADGENKSKPRQIWTEGEPESSSTWFPTIDRPNQKTTGEILITAPGAYVTLSNGRLVSQQKHPDGTRTDHWKMDLPHAPYLFMMAVGDFRIYKDTWRGKEVSYYLEPRYAPYAKEIFGDTPEMIGFFSGVLGIDYPWVKYSQVVVRDYVSGAMENTTATVMGESAQGTPKELADRYYDTGIAHELFHQWFGDYVTAESWSHLTLNESLAVFGEIMWLEKKYGKDVADAHNWDAMRSYLGNEAAQSENLVRFNYREIPEVFDGVTYQKGGCILYMLRHCLGDSAFYKGLNLYLRHNAFKSAEAHQLRLAFEEASGLDLNWFFDQWYFGAGHPELKISYGWDEKEKLQTIYLEQVQVGTTFRLPIDIDFYTGGMKERRTIWMKEKMTRVAFHFSSRPELVNVDAGKVLVCRKTDNKTMTEFAFQYFNAPLYADRYESLVAARQNPDDSNSRRILLAALNDNYYGLRLMAIQALSKSDGKDVTAAIPVLKELILHDSNTRVKAAAIQILGNRVSRDNLLLFKHALQAKSYVVQAASLTAIGRIDSSEALFLARQFESDNKRELGDAIFTLYTTYGRDDQWNYIYGLYRSLVPPKQNNIVSGFAHLVGRVRDPVLAQQGIAAILELWRQGRQYGITEKFRELLSQIKKQRLEVNDVASAAAVDGALKEIATTL